MMLKVKNIHRLFSITLIFLALLTFITVVAPVTNADQNIASKTTDAYDYPVRPGSSEWAAFTTHTEMLEACQIPEAILENMSTAGLVETVLNYPLAIDMWAFNDIQTGFEAISLNFNGIQELLTREDVATELISKYKTLDLSSVNDAWTPLQRGQFILGKITAIEMLLSQDTIIVKMSEMEQLDLLTQVRTNYGVKQQKEEFYGWPSLGISSLIIERVTERHWAERGVCLSGYTTSIQTPEGSTVPGTYQWITGTCTDHADPGAVDAYWQASYPQAWLWSTSTWKYNCHSLAWYQQSSSNVIWMNSGPSIYWTDGSYSYIGVWPTGFQDGRKVFYDSAWGSNYDHSGVAATKTWPPPTEQWVMSKWGSGPLMAHAYNYCPYWSYNPTVKIYG